MSSASNIARYSIILKELRKRKYTHISVLVEKVKEKSEYLRSELGDKHKMGDGERTIKRSFKEIFDLWNILIEYDYSERGYYIVNEESETNDFMDWIDSYEIMQTIRSSSENLPYVFLENRKAAGTENFKTLLQCIKDKSCIQISHKKYWADAKSTKQLKPIALKEYRYRWYLIALDMDKNDEVRTYGLDRISDIIQRKRTFKLPKEIEISKLFEYSFGIIYNQGEPEKVLLSFKPFQANYVKSLKLHPSQEVVFEDINECQIALNIHVTFDFEQELISLGVNVKVLKPKSLANRIRKAHLDAAKQYS